jgi:fanconi anemia group J protein
MDTFASELKTSFPLQLEANHVIDNSQIFVGVFPRGPSGSDLIGTFQHTSSFSFQDDISQSIYDICRVTPFGILCFFPSYALLEKILERMQRTGKYKEILQMKEIVIEPRSGPAEDFERIIRHYYKTISECRRSETGTTTVSTRNCITGAIFFAVYRGKVSEGLDFADENARAVINIGIPYPAFKDPRVTLKKEYNDRHCKTGGSLLSGGLWYETQAFRALNQALGRCIRHRRDWGAVIFLDQRFNSPRNIQKLSKWVRPSVKSFPSFPDGISALRQFMKSKSDAKLPEEHSKPEESEVVVPLAHDPFSEKFRSSNKKTGDGVIIKDFASLDDTTNSNASSSSNRTTNSFFSKRGKTLGARTKRPFI